MRDTVLKELLRNLHKALLFIESSCIGLRLDIDLVCTELISGCLYRCLEQSGSQALPPCTFCCHDPADGNIFAFHVPIHNTQTGCNALRVLQIYVQRFFVAAVHVVIDTLLIDNKHLLAKLQNVIQFTGCKFVKSLDKQFRSSHLPIPTIIAQKDRLCNTDVDKLQQLQYNTNEVIPMCGRFFLDSDNDSYDEILEQLNRTDNVKTEGTVYPTDTVPIIANNKKLKPSVFSMKWGYTSFDGKPVINARSETAAEKPMFRDSMGNRRCIIPAGGYIEWERQTSAHTAYRIRPNEVKLMYMAGLYRFENGLPVFTILTRSASPSVSHIHNRMPLILPQELICDWLSLDTDPMDLMHSALLNMTTAPMQ